MDGFRINGKRKQGLLKKASAIYNQLVDRKINPAPLLKARYGNIKKLTTKEITGVISDLKELSKC